MFREQHEEEAAEDFLVHVAIHFGGQKSARCSGPHQINSWYSTYTYIHNIYLDICNVYYAIDQFCLCFFGMEAFLFAFWFPTHQTRFYRPIEIISSNGLGWGLRCQNVPIIHLLAISSRVLDSVLFYMYYLCRSIVCLGMCCLFWVCHSAPVFVYCVCVVYWFYM